MDPTTAAGRRGEPAARVGRMEQLVESIAERVVSLVLDAIDINAIVGQVDMDALWPRWTSTPSCRRSTSTA